MSLPRRRFAKPLTTRRYLALRHGRKKAEKLDSSDVQLEPGFKELFSFERPGILAGTHTIQVTQKISTNPRDDKSSVKPELEPTVKQEFEVLAPRFELPADAVYSVYPAPGQEATHDTLPHIVFNDRMLPWERPGSEEAEDHNPEDYRSNRVPWLACLVFTPDELRLEAAEMAQILAQTSIKENTKQNESLAVMVPTPDLVNLDKGTAKTPFTDVEQATKPNINVIFPQARLVNGFFSAYNDSNEPLPSPSGGPDVSRHRFLAHLMRINTAGMAEADRDEHEETREFSVVLANRVGPLEGDKPVQVIVHVVSLEGLENLRPFPLPVSSDPSATPVRVGLVSLYSWSYMCQPPGAPNVSETFKNISHDAQMLRPSLPSAPDSDPIKDRMRKRLEDGYSLIRSRTATGEVTAALMRGPLTPNVVPSLEWDILSNSGSGLQILDRELGIMDLTFSAAWSLGRTLALADRSFTISLTRIRHQILKLATDEARAQMIKATSRSHLTRVDLASSLGHLVDGVVDLSREAPAPQWTRPASAAPDLSYTAVAPLLESTMTKAAYQVAASLDPKPPDWTLSYEPPYDEFNEPASPDWMTVFRFVLDLYYLVNVPSHYLLTDQSHLPRESLRFFFIDHNWVEALIDGALSLGNQGGADSRGAEGAPADDPVRRSIKKAFNRLFNEPGCAQSRPAIPRFGFYLRSQVVTQFPDLKVSVDPIATDLDKAPMLLRHDLVDKETMLAFFSDQPLKTGLQGLRFELPPHQSYFSAATLITTQVCEMSYKKQFTVPDPNDPLDPSKPNRQRNQPIATLHWDRNGKGTRTDDNPDGKFRSPFFVWGTTETTNDIRLLLVEKMTEDVYQTLKLEMNRLHPGWFTEPCATSAVASFQLSSPSWQLQIGEMPEIDQANAVSLITGCLSYREAPATGPLKVQTLHAKIPMDLLTLEELSQLPGLIRQALPPHGKSLGLPVPDSAHWVAKDNYRSRNTSTPTSWHLVGTDSPQIDEEDSDFEDISLPAPVQNPIPERSVGLPVFQYHISPTSKPSANTIPIIKQRQDLIFSIVYDSGGRDFALKSLKISIPVQATTDRNNLLKDAGGTRQDVRMVSNLRFTVRSSYSVNEGALELTLVPRSVMGRKDGVPMDGWVGRLREFQDSKSKTSPLENPVWKRTELSVLLSSVTVVPYERDTDCKVWITASYKGNSESRETVWAHLRHVD